MSFITLFIIWYLIGYIRYGTYVKNYHIDLYDTMKLLNFGDKLPNPLDLLTSYKNNIAKLNSSGLFGFILQNSRFSSTGGFGLVLTLLNGLISPLYFTFNVTITVGYLAVFFFELLNLVTILILSIHEFITNPTFVRDTLVMLCL